jgi:hypothetical protein
MNTERIKDEIRKLNQADKIAIYRWIDVYRWIDEKAEVRLLLTIGISATEKSRALHGRN